MLRSLKDIEGYKVGATDGDIGHVKGFYFDDHHWTIRYLQVDTSGFWEAPNLVLISPAAFRQVEWATRRFHLAMSCDKVKRSPSFPMEGSPTRSYELDYYRYFNWPHYWGRSSAWGDWKTPQLMAAGASSHPSQEGGVDNANLRKVGDVVGCRIEGTDDELGKVEDFIVDDSTWAVRYVVVDTGNWWSGKSVILASHWIERIEEKQGQVFVNMTRETIRNSPEWKPDQPVNREYEARLFDYYGRPTYWTDEKNSDS